VSSLHRLQPPSEMGATRVLGIKDGYEHRAGSLSGRGVAHYRMLPQPTYPT